MTAAEYARAETGSLNDFYSTHEGAVSEQSLDGEVKGRLNLDPGKTRNGIAQLVLTLVKLLHELLERQALRRVESGTLTDEEIERLGFALMKQAEELERMYRVFGMEEHDINIDLGPLGKLL